MNQTEPIVFHNIVLCRDNIPLINGKNIQQIALLSICAVSVQLSFDTVQLHQKLLDDGIPELLMLLQTIFVLSYMDGDVVRLFVIFVTFLYVEKLRTSRIFLGLYPTVRDGIASWNGTIFRRYCGFRRGRFLLLYHRIIGGPLG